MAIILKANKVNLFVSYIFVCFLVPVTELFRHTTYYNSEGSTHKCGCFQGPVAQAVVEQAQRDGQWVYLQNCHLAVPWMSALEKICDSMSTANTNINFRLWMTSCPSDKVIYCVQFVGMLLLGASNAIVIMEKELFDFSK
jgi:hypothetical protein